jgi:glycosyltransferase involved in cell wall biosynthesis
MNENSINEKYNILVVIRWPIGGIRTFCKYIYSNFNPDKYNFTILAPDIDETKHIIYDLNKLNPSFIPITQKDKALNKVFNLRVPISSILKGKFNLIHSHGISAGLFSAIPGRLLGIPNLMTIHETLTEEQFKNTKGKLKKLLLSLMLPLTDTIHHVSVDAKNNILENIPVLKKNPDKHMVIQNGINVQQFLQAEAIDFSKEIDLPDNPFLIGFMGRFMPEKGFRYLIDAIEILSKKTSLLKKPIVLAYGWGAFIREERETIKKKRLDKYFRFMPFTSNVTSALKGLDLVAVPSLREACPLLPMEAMVAGVPVIATNCIGLREVVINSPAKIVPTKDPKSLAEAIIKEIKNPSKEKAKSFVDTASKRFDVKKQSKKLEKLILALIKELL